jgi:hypothetical protein
MFTAAGTIWPSWVVQVTFNEHAILFADFVAVAITRGSRQAQW